ncbi:hypothetical protein Q5H93_15675 [Hymenobacter sp. ASUV-10]|uniref:Adhesin domain-containing protein n=1 Tax=Hymenobacter aranciens TaxID=3063996 RepID=A0ABT9BD59_9BACT|nr:hypothetical protein [Hymenobacter sp. ASUV-10]MDO7876184.1 hypothetical protein [Hymenobacter sp. ASUV-10]
MMFLLRSWPLLLTLLTLAAAGPAHAQAPRTVQVLTRTLEQSFACPPGTLVRIRAEKATLRVQGWDQPTVQVVLRLSARHPDRAIAGQDLPAARHQLRQSGGVIDLVNYFSLPANAPALRADLRAEFTIHLPAAAAVEIVNAYGQTFLLDLTGRQQLTQDFGQITLQNLRGSLQTTLRYADLQATNTHLTFTCDADKSALRLTQAAGRYTIRNRYGSVYFAPTAALLGAFIDAERSAVTLAVPQLDHFRYRLATAQGTLTVPPSLAAARRGRPTHPSLDVPIPAPAPLIRVETSYAPLTLETLPPLLIKY